MDIRISWNFIRVICNKSDLIPFTSPPLSEHNILPSLLKETEVGNSPPLLMGAPTSLRSIGLAGSKENTEIVLDPGFEDKIISETLLPIITESSH